MANGKNEPIQFTRGDAERLVKVEDGMKDNGKKLDSVVEKIGEFVDAHIDKHDDLEKVVEANVRFRRLFTKILLWVISTSGGIGIIFFFVERAGWLH